jgi:hypothetical protein
MNKSMQGLGLLAETIEQGRKAGVFFVDDAWQAAGLVWAALNGVLVLMAHPLRQRLLRSDLNTMFQATLDLVVRGLKDGRQQMLKEEKA